MAVGTEFPKKNPVGPKPQKLQSLQNRQKEKRGKGQKEGEEIPMWPSLNLEASRKKKK